MDRDLILRTSALLLLAAGLALTPGDAVVDPLLAALQDREKAVAGLVLLGLRR